MSMQFYQREAAHDQVEVERRAAYSRYRMRAQQRCKIPGGPNLAAGGGVLGALNALLLQHFFPPATFGLALLGMVAVLAFWESLAFFAWMGRTIYINAVATEQIMRWNVEVGAPMEASLRIDPDDPFALPEAGE